jgi:hypothetical protein
MGSVPDFSEFRAWGRTAYVLDLARNKRKLDPKSSQGYFMDILRPLAHGASTCLLRAKIVESPHVRFDE